MKLFTKTYSINAPIKNVWDALTDPAIIAAWGGGPAKMTTKKDAKFSLWGGDIYGTNTMVTPNKLLRQDWYSGDWKEPSIVTFELSGNTKVKLTHAHIPDNEFEDIVQGWDDYYMFPLKKLVESH